MSSTSVETRTGQIVWHDHVSTDREAAKRFYGELLGWEFKEWEGAEQPYSMISSGDTEHGGFIGVEPQEGFQAHWGAYVVADVDAAVERARAAGATVYVEPKDIPEVGRFGVFGDPQGAIISPFAPSYDSPAPQGTFVWDELLTPDVEAAKRYYADVFGWTNREMDMGEAGTYTLFVRGDGEDVAGAMQPQQPLPRALWQTYLAADDVDATTKRAAELGATVLLEPTTVKEVGRMSVLTDPTGAFFGLFQAPA
jgi:uncharacterized protein